MWARIDGDRVAEITDIDPNGRFHPSLQWEIADETISRGDIFDGKAYSKPVEPLADLATRKCREIEAAMDAELAEGFPYTMPDGTDDVVQIRIEDRQNLLGLAIEARDLQTAGITDPVQEFRAKSNIRYPMTPAKMITMTDAALDHYKALLQKCWNRKDATNAALAAGDRAAIEAVEW